MDELEEEPAEADDPGWLEELPDCDVDPPDWLPPPLELPEGRPEPALPTELLNDPPLDDEPTGTPRVPWDELEDDPLDEEGKDI